MNVSIKIIILEHVNLALLCTVKWLYLIIKLKMHLVGLDCTNLLSTISAQDMVEGAEYMIMK